MFYGNRREEGGQCALVSLNTVSTSSLTVPSAFSTFQASCPMADRLGLGALSILFFNERVLNFEPSKKTKIRARKRRRDGICQYDDGSVSIERN